MSHQSQCITTVLLGSCVCSKITKYLIGTVNCCAMACTWQALGKHGGKRFPLPNTYCTVLGRYCELQDPIDARSLSIMAQVRPTLEVYILTASMRHPIWQLASTLSTNCQYKHSVNGQALEEEKCWPWLQDIFAYGITQRMRCLVE